MCGEISQFWVARLETSLASLASLAYHAWRDSMSTATAVIPARNLVLPEGRWPGPGLTDAEAIAAIDRAFDEDYWASTSPEAGRRSDAAAGPRDVRQGDRWLPWHFDRPEIEEGPAS